ncbi:MAG: hypothetical protein V4710_23280 [Verrucomicrobiota bacterium]
MAFLVLVVWLLLCFLASTIADKKGRSGIGIFLLSVFLSPLVGILVTLILSPNTKVIRDRQLATGSLKQCPYCAELVQMAAILCPHCRQELVIPSFSPPAKNYKMAIITAAFLLAAIVLWLAFSDSIASGFVDRIYLDQ